LQDGILLGGAGVLLAAKAALSRDMRVPLDALKRPHPSLKRPQRHLDNAQIVALDPVTHLVLCSDNTFFIHCNGRSLPMVWTASGGFSPMRHEAVDWAGALCSTWKALADDPWTLAPRAPHRLPTAFTCPLWLEVDGWTPEADRFLAAITALVDTTALGLAPEAAGWVVDVYNGSFQPSGFQPGFLLYDTHGASMGLSARVQKALREDGRLDRLLHSHHLLVHRVGRDLAQLPVCGGRDTLAAFTVGASSAHQRMSGLTVLGELLNALPQH
jgi:hypothetical protein